MIRRFFLPATSYKLPAKRSAASLAAMLILGGVILEIGVASAVLVFLLTSGTFSTRVSNEAYAAARAGVSDVVIKIARDKDFSDCPLAAPCVLSVSNNSSFSVVFTRNIDPLKTNHTITSIGYSLTKARKLCATIDVDDVTGFVIINSIKEITTDASC